MITTRRGMFLAAPASHALVAFAACATGAGCGIAHGPNRKDGQRKEKRTYYIAVSRCSLAHRAGLTEIETLFESLVTMHKRIELRTPRLSACGCRTLERGQVWQRALTPRGAPRRSRRPMLIVMTHNRGEVCDCVSAACVHAHTASVSALYRSEAATYVPT